MSSPVSPPPNGVFSPSTAELRGAERTADRRTAAAVGLGAVPGHQGTCPVRLYGPPQATPSGRSWLMRAKLLTPPVKVRLDVPANVANLR